MCYRCGLCQSVVPPRQPRRVHVVTRLVPRRQQVIGRSQPYGEGGYSRPIRVEHPEREEIAREIPVCGSCQSALTNGVPMTALTRVRRTEAPLGRGIIVQGGKGKAHTVSGKLVAAEAEVTQPSQEESEPSRPAVVGQRPPSGPITLGGRVVRRKTK